MGGAGSAVGEALQAAGIAAIEALNRGYQLAFGLGAAFALVAGPGGAGLMRTPHPASSPSPTEGEPA